MIRYKMIQNVDKGYMHVDNMIRYKMVQNVVQDYNFI